MFTLSPELQDAVGISGLKIVLILLIGIVLYQLMKRFIDRVVPIRRGAKGRERTLRRVVVLFLRIGFLFLFGGLILSELGISMAPLLASIGIFGLAFSFGAQYLVRDLISGFFLISEDLCRVGEIIEVAGKRGAVTGIRLRTIILKQDDGTVIFVPYGEIKTLVNYSR